MHSILFTVCGAATVWLEIGYQCSVWLSLYVADAQREGGSCVIVLTKTAIRNYGGTNQTQANTEA